MKFPKQYKINISKYLEIVQIPADEITDPRDVVLAEFWAASKAHAKAVYMTYTSSLTDEDISALRLVETSDHLTYRLTK